MADAYGRLTGRAGVCLGTLGPGATNLVTAVADAFLDRAPLVALTGQSDLERMHKESHQYIDLIAILRPIVKWNARVSSPEIVPEVVRKAFKVAESEKPGSTHLELPEDVMARPLDASPLPRHAPVQPEPGTRELQRATESSCAAENPIILAGNGAIRTHASRALRAFVAHDRDPGRRDVHGQGAARLRGPPRARHRRAAVARLRDGRVRRRRRGDRGRLRPRRARARALESQARQADRRDRHGRRRDRRVLHPRGRAGRRHRPRARPAGRGLPAGRRPRTRRRPPARARARRAARRPRRRPLPDAPAAGAGGHPRGARPRRHPGLRRRPAQAVDRADVPGPRAGDGADRQRPGRDGVRAADRDRRQARRSATATWSRSMATAGS